MCSIALSATLTQISHLDESFPDEISQDLQLCIFELCTGELYTVHGEFKSLNSNEGLMFKKFNLFDFSNRFCEDYTAFLK